MNDVERQELKAQLDRIERCLTGDEAMGQMGIVKTVRWHGTRIARIEKLGPWLAGAVFVIGLAYKVVTDWWPHR